MNIMENVSAMVKKQAKNFDMNKIDVYKEKDKTFTKNILDIMTSK